MDVMRSRASSDACRRVASEDANSSRRLHRSKSVVKNTGIDKKSTDFADLHRLKAKACVEQRRSICGICEICGYYFVSGIS